MEIDLELYKIFVSVASNGSLSKAAAELSVTQSAVSQSIFKLEHIFGKELFVRSRQGVKLTDFGRKLFEEVNASIRQLSVTYSVLSNESSDKGVIRIGASSTITKNIILPKIKKYFPDKHFFIESVISDKDKIVAVENGNLDFALINDYNLPIAANTYKKSLLCLEYSFFYNSSILSVDENNVFDNTLIVKNASTKGRNEFNKNYYSLASKFKNILELSHDSEIIEAVRLGLGIGFCPRQYLFEDFAEVKLSDKSLTKNIVIIYQQYSDIIEKFLK